MDIFLAVIITICTGVILLLASYKTPTELKLLMLILTAGVFLYSGIGIAYYSVNDKYVVHYLVFLFVLLFTIKLFCSGRVRFTFGNAGYSESTNMISNRVDNSLEGMEKIVLAFTVLFFLSYFFNIIYPTNRIASLFDFSNFTSYGIHARRLEHNSYVLLKLSDAIGIAMLPFFFVYLYKCATKDMKGRIRGFILILIWILLSFGKYNYLSRYELVVYLGFIVMYFLVCKYKKIRIDKTTVLIILIAAVVLIPFLVSFTDLRQGKISADISFIDAISKLIEGECYYPEYYDICIDNAGLINPVDFVLWMLFLPIPSVIWPGKPVVQIAYAFTGLFTTNAVTAANYSNLLPSVLGESFLIFGQYWFWVEAAILGLVIGIYFKFFLRSEKLSMLNAYMLLMLATIGRGGAQSYVSIVINGSIVLIIWLFLARRIKV